MSKKFVALICLVLVCLVAFGACAPYKFTALEGNTGGAVSYVGSTVIVKGEYTYFINGAVDFTMSNTFGEVVKGSLARIKTADIGKEDALIEIVVPKILYKASIEATGFVIYNETLYYSSPSTTKDKNSNIQSSMLDIMSVNLDGTGTKRLMTLESNAYNFHIMQQGGKVYLTYFNDGKIYCADLTANRVKAEEVAENVSAYKADVKNNVAYFTQNVIKTSSTGSESNEPYNLLMQVTPNGTITEIKSGKRENPVSASDGNIFAIIRAENGKLYYSVTNSTINMQNLCEYSGGDHTILVNTTMFTDFLVWNGKIVTHNGEGIKVITFDKASGTYSARVVTVVSAATLHSIDGNTLYFVMSNKLYHCNLNDTRKEAKVLVTSMMTTAWAKYEVVKENGKTVVYFFNSSASISNYLYRAFFDDENEIVEERLAILTEDDLEIEAED